MVPHMETGFLLAFRTVTSLPSGLIFFPRRWGNPSNLINLELAPVLRTVAKSLIVFDVMQMLAHAFIILFCEDFDGFGICFSSNSLSWALDETDYFWIDSDVYGNGGVQWKQRCLSTRYFIYY